MAKERPTQVGISLEGVICEAGPSTSILLKFCIHVSQFSGGAFQLR